jgi:alkylation response protein AidB-like acyl-CoA dehydrogenase
VTAHADTARTADVATHATHAVHVAEGDADLAAWAAAARAWLEAHAARRPRGATGSAWGEGSDDVSVFHDLSDDEEQAVLDRAMAWQVLKYDAGYGAIDWPVEAGGAGLTPAHRQAFEDAEADFVTPGHHETFSVTRNLVAPTLLAYGTPEQQRDLMPRFLRTTELCCQLFSEPGAGSDLAGLSTRAARDGDDWVVNGQKTWSSGARFARWGELIARTDVDVPKHTGQTAFVMPMDLPGITIVPIRQMSGGASFNEVFFDDVRVPDACRLGPIGEGWKVALTTLGFERSTSGSDRGGQSVGGSWDRLRALAAHVGATGDPVVRQELASLYALDRIRDFLALRTLATVRGGGTPGPEASAGKLLWTQWMTRAGDAAAALLGPRIAADTGEWGTYAWAEHLLGAPGYRIAGGSDEVQRTIIAERVLGLPREPDPNRGKAFRDIPR